MNIAELFLIAVGLSMDAFAVSVCKGLSMEKFTWKKAGIVGAYFGVFQAGICTAWNHRRQYDKRGLFQGK